MDGFVVMDMLWFVVFVVFVVFCRVLLLLCVLLCSFVRIAWAGSVVISCVCRGAAVGVAQGAIVTWVTVVYRRVVRAVRTA
jgi:hypothetical protein